MSEDNTENKRKFGAFGTSLLLHGAILLAIATLTIELTMPEGNVSGSIEFDTTTPEGSQLETVNVAPVAQPEAPELVKQRAAPVPPPPPPAKEKAEIPDDFLAAPSDKGDLPVMAEKELDTPKDPEPEPDKELPPPILPEKVTETEPVPEPEPKATPQEAPVPVAGKGAPTSVNAGQDAADMKGQEQVSDQNYGTAQGMKIADQHLSLVPGNRQPEYPWQARLRRIEGQVLTTFYVNERGEVSNVQIVQSSHEIFNDSVLKTVSSWKYRAPVQAGQYAQPFHFRLKGEAKENPGRLRR